MIFRIIYAIALGVLVACTLPYYEDYQAAHPEWDAKSFPRLGADLAETIAGLHAPRASPDHWVSSGNTGSVHSARVFDITAQTWREISLPDAATTGRQTDPHSYLVVARLGCSNANIGLSYVASAVAWYLLQEDELVSFSDVRFGGRCTPAPRRELDSRTSVEYADCLSHFAQTVMLRELDLSAEGCGPPT